MKVQTDICVIGAGPIGLFAVFQAGLLKMSCQVVNTLLQVGDKQMIDNLMEQISPFNPGFTLGEHIGGLSRFKDGSFMLSTNGDTEIECKAVVIAGGLECLEPQKPVKENLSLYEDNWNIAIGQSGIKVDGHNYQTNIPGVFAIGDINTYPGKEEFFQPGFREAAIVSQSAYNFVHPLQLLRFECKGIESA